jgi:hypothetical protein
MYCCSTVAEDYKCVCTVGECKCLCVLYASSMYYSVYEYSVNADMYHDTNTIIISELQVLGHSLILSLLPLFFPPSGADPKGEGGESGV